MSTKTLREASKSEFSLRGHLPTTDELNAGSLQRIADACEKMAVRYDEMVRRCEEYKSAMEYAKAERDALDRHARSLRGVITRLKRQR